MKLYIDESGSITTSNAKRNRYFIMSFVHTNEPYKVIREFRRAKIEFLKIHSDIQLDIKKEIKGSEMTFGMKKHIFEHLKSKTDVSFHFMVIDNQNLKTNLREKPSISFNYFISLAVKKIRNNVRDNDRDLFLLIDERNQSVGSLNSLSEYLQIELSIKTNHYDKIKVNYKDSKTKDLIQIADIFSNTIYRVCQSELFSREDKKIINF
ncbi:DUF3800 domain-containing protein [Globicatella sanguinis]